MLMRDGWLKAADMVGLQSYKIAEVKASVGALRRISQVRFVAFSNQPGRRARSSVLQTHAAKKALETRIRMQAIEQKV